jgi:hypothetical protein
VDKKTKRLLKKLMQMGVMPMTGDRPAPTIKSDIYEKNKQVADSAAFRTTATAQIPIVKPLESVGEVAVMRTEGDESQEGTTVVWSPEDGESEGK